ncbi:MAG TPA: Hsp20/alpha crystallin family protein [Dehalococcoidia bacterium]|nr:Hsp20/alpha crystallin family protein [Dehalococcoidia bacterium]
MAERLPILRRPFFAWRPWRELEEIEEEFDRLWREWGPRMRAFMPRMVVPEPALDVYRKDGNLIVEVDAPGMKREDFTVEIDGRTLKISGERKEEQEIKEEDYYRCERSYGRFSRWIDLPEDVSIDDATATYENGVLKITLPAAQKAKPEKKIEIK